MQLSLQSTGPAEDSPLDEYEDLRRSVTNLCKRYPFDYWHDKAQEDHYPFEFLRASTQSSHASIEIPRYFGGGGRSFAAVSCIVEEMHRCGCDSGVLDTQFILISAMLKFALSSQKGIWLPPIASGHLRLQACTFLNSSGLPPPSAPVAVTPSRGGYLLTGKVSCPRNIQQTDLMLVLVSIPGDNTPCLFVVEIEKALRLGATLQPHWGPDGIARVSLRLRDTLLQPECALGKPGIVEEISAYSDLAQQILNSSKLLGTTKYLLGALRKSRTASSYGRDSLLIGGEGIGIDLPAVETSLKSATLAFLSDPASCDLGLAALVRATHAARTAVTACKKLGLDRNRNVGQIIRRTQTKHLAWGHFHEQQ